MTNPVLRDLALTSLPPEGQRALVRTGDVPALQALAFSPHTDPGVLSGLCRHEVPVVRRMALAHTTDTSLLVEGHGSVYSATGVASNPRTTPSVLASYAGRDNVQVNRALLRNPSTPTSTVVELVAGRPADASAVPNTPTNSASRSARTGSILAVHPVVAEYWVTDPDSVVRRLVGRTIDLPTTLVRSLLSVRGPRCSSLVSNPTVDESLLPGFPASREEVMMTLGGVSPAQAAADEALHYALVELGNATVDLALVRSGRLSLGMARHLVYRTPALEPDALVVLLEQHGMDLFPLMRERLAVTRVTAVADLSPLASSLLAMPCAWSSADLAAFSGDVVSLLGGDVSRWEMFTSMVSSWSGDLVDLAVAASRA